MPSNISIVRARSAAGAALVCLLFAFACDGDPTDPDPGGVRGDPGLHIVGGGSATDTIGTELVQALVVQLFDEDGRAAEGVVIRFEATSIDTPVFVGRIDSQPWSILTVDTTDERGRASALLRLGDRVGDAGVAIVVPELGIADTATYTITPGQPASMMATPADTAAYVGNPVTIAARIFDRAGNPIDRPAQLVGLSGSIDVDGDAVTGSAVGRASVEVSSAGFVDTTWISVVPEGTLAAYVAPPHTGFAVELYTFNLDGSDLRRVATTKIGAGYFGEMGATWSADGSRLVYHDNNSDHTKTLYEVDLATLVSTRFIEHPGELEDERWPLFSPDGEWVLFNGGTFWEQTAYRVRADGTDPEPIGPPGALHAAMSPDGNRLAVQRGDTIAVVDLASGIETSLGVRGWLPVWSPSGDLIYYTGRESDWDVAGRVRAISPNGTGDRAVSSSRIRWRVTVSPDGEWLVGALQGSPNLLLIDADTGAEMPLPLVVTTGEWWHEARSFSMPVWKP